MFERHRLALVVAASVEFGPPDQRASLRPRDALAQGAFLCEGSTSSSGYQLAVIASTEQTDAGEIREKETKSGKIRTVALPSMAVEELQRWHVTQAQELLRLGVRIDDSWHVVTKADGRPVQPRSLTHVVSAFLEEWGVTLHKLRHSRQPSARRERASQSRSGAVRPFLDCDHDGHLLASDAEHAERSCRGS